MEKLVISGSSKLEDKVNYWINFFETKGYEVLNYPKLIEKEHYERNLTEHYESFYSSIEKTDIFFFNE